MNYFTHAELLALVLQTMSILERKDNLADDYLDSIGTLSDEESLLVDNRLNQWKKVITHGSNLVQGFERRLEIEDLNEDKAKAILNSTLSPKIKVLPAWALLINDIFKWIQNRPTASDDLLSIAISKTIPFCHILVPIVSFANQQLNKDLNHYTALLSLEARVDLQLSLLEHLSTLTEKIFWINFQAFISKHSYQDRGNNEDNYYQAYIHSLLEGELKEVFHSNCVLAKLIATSVDQWIVNTTEFLSHLNKDISSISMSFNNEKPIRRVSNIQCDLSDRHNKGKTVLILTFECGFRLVYKPHSLATEHEFYKFIHSFNGFSSGIALKAVQVIDMIEYGWAEYIHYTPCKTQTELGDFYERIGALLCITYVLEGTDFHLENLIAEGAFPVLVDLESLLHSSTQKKKRKEDVSNTEEDLSTTVLKTGLLPIKIQGKSGVVYDISALGACDNQRTGSFLINWNNINTDKMHFEHVEEIQTPAQNIPFLYENKIPVKGFEDYVEKGFRKTYKILNQHKAVFTHKSTSPLIGFSGITTRYITRATGIYGGLLEHINKPEFLANGIDRSIELDILARAILMTGRDNDSTAWPIFKEEIAALEAQDIPYFYAKTNSRDLFFPEGKVSNFFKAPSYEVVMQKIHNLDDTDCDLQCGYIKKVLFNRFSTKTDEPRSSHVMKAKKWDYPVSHYDFLNAALSIGNALEKHAIQSADGEVSWPSMSMDIEGVIHTDESFYSGRLGVAFFFAALAVCSQDERFKTLSQKTIKPLMDKIQSPHIVNSLGRKGLGAGFGVGGLMYGLAQLSQWLDWPEALESAVILSGKITPSYVEADVNFDVLSGTAGGILGLLALYKVWPNKNLLPLMKSCGYHLLAQQLSHTKDEQAWLIKGEKRPLTGFSHGAAGISYALFKLYEMTQEEVFLLSARKGIEFEHAVFSEDNGNWPDFRVYHQVSDHTEKYRTSWCHGATGIGLARLGTISIFNNPIIKRDIDAALKTTLSYPLGAYDSLCCGNMGRIEFLLAAGHAFKREDLLQAATEKARSIIADRVNQPYLTIEKNIVNSPSLFMGGAGVGYTFLRLLDRNLPNILLFE